MSVPLFQKEHKPYAIRHTVLILRIGINLLRAARISPIYGIKQLYQSVFSNTFIIFVIYLARVISPSGDACLFSYGEISPIVYMTDWAASNWTS